MVIDTLTFKTYAIIFCLFYFVSMCICAKRGLAKDASKDDKIFGLAFGIVGSMGCAEMIYWFLSIINKI